MTEPPKKKRLCSYKKEWELKRSWVKPVVGDEKKVFCTLCRREFAISHGGEHDLSRHEDSDVHKKAVLAKGASNITSFFASSIAEKDKIAASEVTYVYHTIKHGLSYNSTDCAVKLNETIFQDSLIAKKMHLGRTKAEMISMDVLGPSTVGKIVTYLSPAEGEPVYFSIASDASNKGNRKMFPVCVRYFSVSDGVQSKLLDFYEDSDETANGIHQALMTCLEKYELDIRNITAYSADNANVNYGKHHSVYKLLSSANDAILKANCPAHIAHNACKHASDQLSVDIETIVLKIYSHFSVSASRREELQWREILRHVCTRWLSLHPAVNRLLETWPALTSYFRSLGENCPVALRKTFEEEVNTDTAEIYLCFFHNVGCVFDLLVKKLELTDLCITDVYEEVRKFEMKMLQRKEDSFFGFQTKRLMEKQLPAQRSKIQEDFLKFYDSVITYISKWFDFSSDNVMVQLKPIGLYDELSFPDLEQMVAALKLTDRINMDQLYEEFCASREEIQKATKDTTKPTCEKWVAIFQKVGKDKMTNMFRIVSFVLSVPGSNAFVERIFSLMANKWSDSRNRCSTELIKNELLVAVNCDLSCKEFYLAVQKDKKMLESVRSSKKYPWKQ
ncbi:hypothetical protein N1851_028718 [Merluccius polli]|uniref:Uncharacterized protein n=1 Tax=Merluccius polli TaxID=89951 RepID=A0AA47NRA4_MERPO|nr:hypothetical protein N1851_028718 [Merluccius polli]